MEIYEEHRTDKLTSQTIYLRAQLLITIKTFLFKFSSGKVLLSQVQFLEIQFVSREAAVGKHYTDSASRLLQKADRLAFHPGLLRM